MSYDGPTPEQIDAARGHFFVKGYPYPPLPKRPLGDLNEANKQIVAKRRAAVHEHMPELVPIIKELHEAGMIDGWRGVGEVVIHASTSSARTDLIEKGKNHGTD